MTELLLLVAIVGWMLALVQTIRHIEVKYGPKARVSETPDEDPR